MKIRLIISTITVLPLFVSGLWRVAGKANSTAQADLRLGFFANVTHAAALIGANSGRFQQALGDARLGTRVFTAGPEAIEALRAGGIDVAYVGPGPALTAFMRARDIVIIAGAARGGSLLVAGERSTIDSVRGLSGARVAFPQIGGTQDVLARHVLEENGLAATEHGGTVTLLPLANADTLGAMMRGDVDAALVPEPWGSRLLADAHAKLLLDSDDLLGGKYPSALIIARQSFAQAKPELLARLLQAHQTVTNELAADPRSFAPAVNQAMQRFVNKSLNEELLRSALGRIHFDTSLRTVELAEFARLTKRAGFFRDEINLDGILWSPSR